MSIRKSVKLSEETHNILKIYCDLYKHKTMDKAIAHLLSETKIQETIKKFKEVVKPKSQ
jgi:acyl-[acyl carrier protein]--UDP-N-acetylglucosamine O-acyltransferase